MSEFTESGITLDFEGFWFRFQDSNVFARIPGEGNKKMDACCVDEENRVVYSIELKDFTTAGSLVEGNLEKRFINIFKKSIDTMQMLLSVVYQTSFGIDLEQELSYDLHSLPYSLHLVTIINEVPSNELLVQVLRTKCMACLKPYTRIWDNIRFSVVTYRQAKRFLPFVR